MYIKKIGIVLTLFIVATLRINAQQDPSAQKLLNAVSKQYLSYQHVKINFAIKGHNAEQQNVVNESGELYLQPKSDKFRLSTKEQEIISDGNTQWTVLKEEGEVQVTNLDKNATSLTPANLFTFYERGFKYVSGKDEQLKGKTYKVVDLTPIDNTKSFFKVRLRIDQTKRQIYDATVFDKGGSRFTYTILKLVPNPQVNAKIFTFDKSAYPGMEVVDLR